LDNKITDFYPFDFPDFFHSSNAKIVLAWEGLKCWWGACELLLVWI